MQSPFPVACCLSHCWSSHIPEQPFLYCHQGLPANTLCRQRSRFWEPLNNLNRYSNSTAWGDAIPHGNDQRRSKNLYKKIKLQIPTLRKLRFSWWLDTLNCPTSASFSLRRTLHESGAREVICITKNCSGMTQFSYRQTKPSHVQPLEIHEFDFPCVASQLRGETPYGKSTKDDPVGLGSNT